jgi:hypothetical protein
MASRRGSEAEEDRVRRERQQAIASRLAAFLKEDPDGTAIALCDLALATLARSHPAKLTPAAKKKILDNYPEATDALIAERAMDDEGVITALAMLNLMGKIALDYSVSSHVKNEMSRDERFSGYCAATLGPGLELAFDEAVDAGVTPFGVACTTILLAVVKATGRGVSAVKLARPLLDAMGLALAGGSERSEKEIEDEAVALVAAQMGVSTAVAKGYLRAAKKMKEQGT